MKKKLLLTSILSIVMCFSLICGATFALFTSESKVNIAVTSGTVSVEATIGDLTLSSTVDGVTTPGVDGKWVNGGTATVDGATITLDKMTPGDTVSFDITVTNHSNVMVKARTIYAATGELVGGLTIDGFGEVQQTGVTLWETLEVGSEAEIYSVSITLDEDAGDEFQNKTAAITFGVEAVQGNAQVDDPFTVRYGETEEKFASFAAALDCYEAAEANEVTIDIAKGTYYNTNVVVEQLENKNLTIQAKGTVTFVNNTSANPVILVDGNSRGDAAETLTFDGLNFELNNGAYGIKFGSGNDLRYAHNVTIKNCSFVGTDNTGYAVQSGHDSSCYNINVSDCAAEGIDTLVSVYSSNLTVSNCTAMDINGFVNNLTTVTGTSVVNCNATVNGNDAGYVVRVKGDTLSVTGSTFVLESKGAYSTGAIVVREGATNVTLANNTITATVADGVNGAAATICQESADLATITSDKAYTLLTGYKSTSGFVPMAWHDGENVENGYAVFNADGLKALNTWYKNNSNSNEFGGKKVIITANIDATGTTWDCVTVTQDTGERPIGIIWDGNNKTISSLTIDGSGLFYLNACKSTFSNLTFDNVTVNGGWHTGVIWGQAYGELTLNNVNVVNSKVTGVCNVGGLVGRNGDDGASIITFKNCSVENTTVTSTGGNGTDSCGASAFLGMALKTAKASLTLTFENCTSTNNNLDTADGQQGGGIYATANLDDATWTEPVVVNDFTNYNNNN